MDETTTTATPAPVYVARIRILHDNVLTEVGQPFTASDDPQVLATLRKSGALALPEEYAAETGTLDTLAEQRAAQQAENEALRARLAELEALLAQSAKSGE